jgi:ABC-type multidrug transport system ATPase subunit
MQFDTVCIMAKGLVAFQGGVQEAFSFWEDQGYTCPANYNPCEYFLCTLRINRNRKEECAKKNEKILARFQETSMFKEIEKLSHRRRWKTIAMSRLERQLFHDRPPYRASVGCQIYWLLKRELSATFRAFFPFYGRLLLTIVISG